jgi:hypothetical protein
MTTTTTTATKTIVATTIEAAEKACRFITNRRLRATIALEIFERAHLRAIPPLFASGYETMDELDALWREDRALREITGLALKEAYMASYGRPPSDSSLWGPCHR